MATVRCACTVCKNPFSGRLTLGFGLPTSHYLDSVFPGSFPFLILVVQVAPLSLWFFNGRVLHKVAKKSLLSPGSYHLGIPLPSYLYLPVVKSCLLHSCVPAHLSLAQFHHAAKLRSVFFFRILCSCIRNNTWVFGSNICTIYEESKQHWTNIL